MGNRVTHARPPLRELLREAGSDAHARLDATFTSQQDGLRGYTRLLQTLHSFHRAADPLLAAWVAASPAAPAVSIPRRAVALRADLILLGEHPGSELDLTALATDPASGVLTDGAGFALLYVLAGSCIGAHVILRHLPTQIPANARAGLREGAGPASVQLWRSTLAALSGSASAEVAAAATRSCVLVFDALNAGPAGSGAAS